MSEYGVVVGRPMKYLHAAVALLIAATIVGIWVSMPMMDASTLSIELSNRVAFVLQLDWLQGLIERVDRFLEAVADLLRTLRGLSGGEGG